MAEPTVAENPLLQQSGLPRFDLIKDEHIEPGMRALLSEATARFDALERDARPDWSLLEELERIGERVGYAWNIVGHLLGVRNTPALRTAHEAVQPEIVAFNIRVAQSEPIYKALCELRDGPGWSRFDAAQRRIVEQSIKEAELSGIALEGEARARFNQIQTELAELSTRFGNHVLDSTKAFELVLTDPAQVDGLPDRARRLYAQSARAAGHEGATAESGPWRVTLDLPGYQPFMTHGRNRALREQLYRAFIQRASEGEFDNRPLIERILRLRREEAQLLGFDTFGDLSLATKMAPSPDAVFDFLNELRRVGAPAAETDMAELQRFAAEQGAPEADDLQHWDLGFWAERLRETHYGVNDEELRPYFPLPTVLAGLFALTERLFGAKVEPADSEAPVWHEDVRVFAILDESGARRATFYLDPYSRPADKRGGAWVNPAVSRSAVMAPPGQSVRLPAAYVCCNQAPPVDGQPSLMSFREVETLFHEFGHALQALLTTVDYGPASGLNLIEWDAVEIASQFMENWCYQRRTMNRISGHVETGEPLPDELFEKLTAARTYRSGSLMMRQLQFGLIDMELHTRFDPDAGSPLAVQARYAKAMNVLPPLPEDRFICAFTHLFAGGYAAGYYSYKWSEVLSADAFGAFEEAGLDDEQAVAAVGRRYRDTILALGGSRPPMEVFVDFRGREPSTEALLRHAGLAG